MDEYGNHPDNEYDEYEAELNLLDTPQNCPAGRGMAWIKQAWLLLKQALGNFLLLGFLNILILGIVNAGLSAIGLETASNIITGCLATLLGAGIITAAASQAETGEMEVSQLFEGFRRNTSQLCILIALTTVIGLAIILLIKQLFPIKTSLSLLEIQSIETKRITIQIILEMSVNTMLWFTLPLIMLHDIPAIAAIKTSFSAVIKNILPITVTSIMFALILFGLVISGGLIFALIAQAVGKVTATILLTIGSVLLILSVFIASLLLVYVSYRDILTDQPME
jgi:membrane protein